MREHTHTSIGILAKTELLIDRSSITLTLICTATVQEESDIKVILVKYSFNVIQTPLIVVFSESIYNLQFQ
jgi:hypothetical protein